MKLIHKYISFFVLMVVSTMVSAQGWTMVNGDTLFISVCEHDGGFIYDNGGPNGNYINNFDGWVVITAPSGVNITLSGDYATENCCDKINVWDGNIATGTHLVEAGGEGSINVVATSGRMTIQFHSDGSVNNSGFSLQWGHQGYTNTCTSGITSFEVTSITATTATLSWTAAASSLILDYGHGPQTVTGSTTTLTGLNPSTLYNVMLYGEGELGSPCCVAQTSFRTGCGLMAAPLVERFDDLTVGVMPPCWDSRTNHDLPEYQPKVTSAQAHSGNKSLLISSGSTSEPNHYAIVIGPKMSTPINTLNLRFSLRSSHYYTHLEVGVCDTVGNQYNYFGFIPIDTIYVSYPNEWNSYTVDLSSYSGNGCRIAFRMTQSMQSYSGSILYLDDLMVEDCGVDSLQVSHRATDALTLHWTLVGNPAVDLTVMGGGSSSVYTNVTSPQTLTGLTPSTPYTLSLTPRCDAAYGAVKTLTISTLDSLRVPATYCQDFDNGWPQEWYKAGIYSDAPTLSSGRLLLRCSGNERSTAVLPRTVDNLSGLTLQFDLSTDQDSGGVIVGVVNYALEPSTFIPLDTLITRQQKTFTISLANYTGSGGYLALQAVEKRGWSCYIYVDNLRLGHCLLSGLTMKSVTGSSITLAWNTTSSDATDGVIIEYGPENFTLGEGTQVTVPSAAITTEGGRCSYTLTGLTLATTYDVAVWHPCGDAVCQPDRITASTLLRDYTVPFCENFDTYGSGGFMTDWTRPSMVSGYPHISYSSNALSGNYILEMYTNSSSEYSTAVLPVLTYGGSISDLVISFHAWREGNPSWLVVGVVTDASDASTFIPIDSVQPVGGSWGHYAVNLASYNGPSGHLALRLASSNGYSYCYLENLLLHTAGIGSQEVYSTSSTGTILSFETVGAVSDVTLRIIADTDTLTYAGISSPYNVSGLQPGTNYHYEIIVTSTSGTAACQPATGFFTTCSSPMQADWCFGFETEYSNYRFRNWSYPYAYGIGRGDRHSGNYGYYLQSYGGQRSVAVTPYIEETDYTGLHLRFWLKGNNNSGRSRTLVGLLSDPRDTIGFVPLDTITDSDNQWRRYDLDLSGHETHGHHVAFIGYVDTSNCAGCGAYTDIDDLRLSRGGLDAVAISAGATTVEVEWTIWGSVDSVALFLIQGNDTVADTTVTSTVGLWQVAGLTRNSTYTLRLYTLTISAGEGCTTEEYTVSTLDHDVGDGYCEDASGNWDPMPWGWSYLQENGSTPYQYSEYYDGNYHYSIRLHSQNPADAYTMAISPRATEPLSNLVLSFGAWESSSDDRLPAILVVGVIENPTDASTFIALDTVRPSNYLGHYTVDLSTYTGTSRYFAFKAMSLEGRDIYTYLTDVSLSHCRPAHLHATEITPQGFTLHWQMMGTGDSLRIVVDDLFDTIVDATPGQCRIERSDWTSSSLQVRVVATCQQMSLECPWQTMRVELPSSPLRIPSCLTLDDVNTTRERSSNNMPYGWTRPYGNDYPRRSSSYRYGSTGNSLEFYAENYSYNRSSMVVSPYIDDNISSAWLEFYIRNGYSRSYFLVGTMTDPTDTATFVAHDTLRQYNDLTYVSLSLANYGGHYLAFRYQADPTNNSGYGYIDNLSLTSCPMPTAWISQPQDTTLGISWDTPTPVWIEYKQGGDFLPGTGTRVLATESPTTIGGLLTATPYTFHVWPQCEAGEEFSCNYRTLEYTTLYPPVAPPYCVNFENYDYYNNYPAEWDRWNPSYTNCYVYTSTGHEDSKSLRLSTYTTGGITYRPVAILPRILPSSLCTDSLYVNFWYKRDWSNSTLAVGIVTDLMDTNTFVPYDTLDATNEWQHHTTALPTAVLHTGRIAVKELTGAAYIDNLCIETCIAAEVAVTDLTEHSATVTWTGHGASALICEYGPQGFAQGTGASVEMTSSPYTITGLDASTTYDFIFRTQCQCPEENGMGVVYYVGGGSGGGYIWGGHSGFDPIEVVTHADPVLTPYCEDFDESSSRPNGWLFRSGSIPGYPKLSDDPACSSPYALDLYTTTGYSNHAILPPVPNPSQLVLSFSAYCPNDEATYTSSYYNILTIGVMTDPNHPETFTSVQTVRLTSKNKWQQVYVDLSSYEGTGQYIAFRFVPYSYSYHYYIDNVFLGSCVVNSSGVATTASSVEVTYTTLGNATGVIVEKEDGAQYIATSSPFTVPGLNGNEYHRLTLRAFSTQDTQLDCHLVPLVVNHVMTLPYCEDFDGVVENYPEGWSAKQIYSSSSSNGVIGGAMQFYMSSSTPDVYLLPPLAAGDTLGGLWVQLTYNANNQYTYNTTSLELGYMTDTNAVSSFVPLTSISNTSVEEFHRVQLPNSSATRLAIRAVSTSGSYTFDIDDLVISRTPLPTATEFSLLLLNSTNVVLTWDADTLAAHYSYQLSEITGASVSSGTTDSCKLALTGLTPSTSYDLYLTAPDGTAACQPIRITTPTPVPIPYCEDFEQCEVNHIPEGWRRIGSGTYPRIYNDHTHDLDFCGDGLQVFILPEPDIPSLHNLTFSAFYNFFGDRNRMEVGVMEDPTDFSTFIPVDTVVCGTSTSFRHTTSFANYTGTGRYIALHYLCYYNAIHMDNVVLDTLPEVTVRAISSSQVILIGAKGLYVELCAIGQTQGMGRVFRATGDTLIIDGLTPGATYDFYHRADSLGYTCAPAVSVTMPMRLLLPHCEEFDTYGSGCDKRPTAWTFSHTSCDCYTTSSNNWSLRFYSSWSDSSSFYASMPDVAIEDIADLSLQMRYRFQDNIFDVEIGLVESPGQWESFVPIDTLRGERTERWYTQKVNMGRGHLAGTLPGRFVAIRMKGHPQQYNTLYIDYIRLQGCPMPKFSLAGYNMISCQQDVDTPVDYWIHLASDGLDSLLHVTETPFFITGLRSQTEYTLSAQCDAYSYSCIPPDTVTTGIFITLPLCEEFSAYGSTSESYPEGWGRMIDCNNDEIHTVDYYGDSALMMYSSYYDDCPMVAVLPDVDVESLHEVSGQICYHWRNCSSEAVVGVMSDPNDMSSFDSLQVLRGGTDIWYTDELDFSSYTGEGRYVAIRMKGERYCTNYLYIGHLYLRPIPLVKLELEEATTITCRQYAVAPDYWLHYTVYPYSDTTRVHVTAASYALENLLPDTTYRLLTTPTEDTTGCWEWKEISTSHRVTLPYCDDFSAYASGTVPRGWTRHTENTGNYPRVYNYRWSDDSYLEYSGSGEQMMVTPDMGEVRGVAVRLSMRVNDTNTRLIVGVLTDAADEHTFVEVDTLRVTRTSEWITVYTSLQPYTGGGHYIGFKRTGSSNYVYIDNLVVDSCDTRATVTLNRSNVVVIDGESGGGFYVEYGPQGFAQGTGTFVRVEQTPYEMELNYSSTYDFYVKCDSGATCNEPYRVTTLASPQALPLCIDFEGMTSVPEDWPLEYSSSYSREVSVVTTESHSGSRSLTMYKYSNYQNTLTLGGLAVDSLSGVTMSFWMKGESGNRGTLTVGVMSDPWDARTFVPVRTFSEFDGSWHRERADFADVPASHHFIAFRIGEPSGSTRVWLDDIYLSECGTHSLEVKQIESESAVLTWRQTGNPTLSVEVVPMGGTTWTVPGVTTSPCVIEGLEALTSYMVIFSAVCDNGNGYCTNDYRDTVHFFTPAGGTGCIDPTNLTAEYTTCTYGTYGNPYGAVGAIDSGAASGASRHTVHYDANERDPRTGGQLRTVAPGAPASVRLGNWTTGGASDPQAEAITYALVPDTMSFDLLILKYAAVMQDPMHGASDQPRFRLELLDSTMNLIDPQCGTADFVANQNLGWNIYGEDILWKDWTTVGIDVSAYAGQTIYVRLTTYDCNEGSHYGYAYFTLNCLQKTMVSERCGEVDSNRFSAPSGFAYSWYTNENPMVFSHEQSIVVPTNNDITYYCNCAFVDKENCYFTLSAFAGTRYPLAQMEYVQTVKDCKIHVDFKNTSTISSDGVTPIGTGEPCETAWWDLGNGDTVTTYNAQGVYDAPGTYTVTLVSGIAGDACLDTAVYTINLTMNAIQPVITGTKTACEGDSIAMTVEHALSYLWSTGEEDSSIVVPVGEMTNWSCMVTDSNGCPDTLYHSATVYPVYDVTQDTAVYEGDFPYTWHDSTFTSVPNDSVGGTFLRHYLSIHGCDSAVHYQLSALFDVEVTFDSTVCESALPFTWNDSVFTGAGSKHLVLPTWYGGDSTITMCLTVEPTTYDTLTQIIVENQLPYTFLDTSFTSVPADSAGRAIASATFRLTNAGGCDSILTFFLQVYENVGTMLYDTVCETELPLLWNGLIFNEAGTKFDTLTASTGADSILTMVLTVIPTTYGSLTQTIVENQLPYTFLDTTFTSVPTDSVGGTVATATFRLTNAAGCDSILSYTLIVYENVGALLYDTVCESELPYTWGGRTFNAAGIQFDTLQTVDGADSILTMQLTVIPTTYASYTEAIVENSLPHTFLDTTFTTVPVDSVGGTASSASATATFRLTNAASCDSILSYTLVVHLNVDTTLYDTICEHVLPYTWNDSIFSAAGSNVTTILNHFGADSTITMHLAVIPTTYGTYHDTIVENQLPYTFYHRTFATVIGDSVADTLHILNVTGCDSILSYSLFVHRNVDTTLFDTVCEGALPYTWNGHTFTAVPSDSTPGLLTAYDTLLNQHGADSVIILQLTVIPTTYGTYSENIVENSLPHTFLDTTFTDSVINFQFSILNSKGCDSILSYTLVVHRNVDTTLYDTVCESTIPYTWNGHTFAIAVDTSTVDTLTDRFGADSTVTMHLTVIPTTYGTYRDTIVENQLPYTFYHRTFAAIIGDSVTDTLHILNVAGCDSILSYSLFVHRNVFVTLYDTVCDNQLPLQWNHRTFATVPADFVGGVFTQFDTLPAHTGADSILTMVLTVHPTYLATDTVGRCQQDFPYTWRDTTFTTAPTGSASGLFQRHHLSIHGCDSTHRLLLTVYYAAATIDTVIACEPYLWIDGIVHQHHDSATFLLHTVHGCDSLVTLDLQMRSPTETFLVDTFCLGSTYLFGSYELTTGGLYVDSLFTVDHCDSLVHLDLTGLAAPSLSISFEHDCETLLYHVVATADVPYLEWTLAGFDWDPLWGDPHGTELWLNPDSATLLILYGDYYPEPTCPSTAEVSLRHLVKPEAAIHVSPLLVTPENPTATLTASESRWADNFAWYIDGEHYSDGISTEYTLPYDADSILVTLVADNGLCADTVSQYVLMRNDNMFIPNIFTPSESSNNRFYIGMKGIIEFEMYIYNRSGLLVYETHDINSSWDGTDPSGKPCPQGAYVYRIRYRNNLHPKEWHSRYGTVTLLR